MKKFLSLLLLIVGVVFAAIFISKDGPEENKAELALKFEEVASYFEVRDVQRLDVSEAAVSWHLDHISLVIQQIYQTLKKSEVEEYS